jgi:hypothetical protein
MSKRSKGIDQTMCSPRSSRLGVSLGAHDPSPRKFTVTKPPEEIHGEGQDQHKEEEEEVDCSYIAREHLQ